jgi:hypothetical protein
MSSMLKSNKLLPNPEKREQPFMSNSGLYHAVETQLNQLKTAILQLQAPDYSRPIVHLSNATIGQHVRHIIELLQCLLQAVATNSVLDYENRPRNTAIEQNQQEASVAIDRLIASLRIADQPIRLVASVTLPSINEEGFIPSSFNRELLYNLEHIIHHMALIRVGFISCGAALNNDDFGVAYSTLQYRQSCAQ